MIQLNHTVLAFLFLLFFIFSCKNQPEEQKPENPFGEKETLMKINKYFVEKMLKSSKAMLNAGTGKWKLPNQVYGI